MRALVWLLLLSVAGCDAVPRDSGGAMERIRGGELHVGISPRAPWIVLQDGRVAGVEAELIQRWARELDARVVFRPGALDDLVEAVHRRELSVLAAGLDTKTPFGPRLALTRPYAESVDAHGRTHEHVLAVTQGESALLLSLDRFLAAQDHRTLQKAVQRAP